MMVHRDGPDAVFDVAADAAPTEGLRLTVRSLLSRTRLEMPPAEFNQLTYQIRKSLRLGPAHRWQWVYYLRRTRAALRKPRAKNAGILVPAKGESERRAIHRRAEMIEAYLERKFRKEKQALHKRLNDDPAFLPVYRTRRKRWLTDFLQAYAKLKTGEQIMRWAARLPAMQPRALTYLSPGLESRTHLRPALNRPKALAVWRRFASPVGTFLGGGIVNEPAVGHVVVMHRSVSPNSGVLTDGEGRTVFQKVLNLADPLLPTSTISTPPMPHLGKLWAFTRWTPSAYLSKSTGAEVSHLYAEANRHLTTYRKANVHATVVFRTVAVPSQKEIWMQLGHYTVGVLGRRSTDMDALLQLVGNDMWMLATAICARHLGMELPHSWLESVGRLDSIADTKVIRLIQ